MERIIIFEGPDNSGKGTQIDILKEQLNAPVIVQPSGDSILGFLRYECKKNPIHKPFERQLLHTISHMVDALHYTYPHENTVIMDRCYLSALVYGESMGLTADQCELLTKIHSAVYKEVWEDVEVYAILLAPESPFSGPDESVYEKLDWYTVKNKYIEVFNASDHYFTETERRFVFKPTEAFETNKKILEIIGEEYQERTDGLHP